MFESQKLGVPRMGQNCHEAPWCLANCTTRLSPCKKEETVLEQLHSCAAQKQQAQAGSVLLSVPNVQCMNSSRSCTAESGCPCISATYVSSCLSHDSFCAHACIRCSSAMMPLTWALPTTATTECTPFAVSYTPLPCPVGHASKSTAWLGIRYCQLCSVPSPVCTKAGDPAVPAHAHHTLLQTELGRYHCGVRC